MDQLLAAGFAPNAEPSARTQPARPQIVKKRTRGSGQGLPLSQLFWQLPRWGTVASWEDGRGFGFIQCGGSNTLFFHVKAEIVGVSSAHQRIRVGEPVVFIIGEDPRKPGNLRAVCWARVSGCHWDGATPPSSQTSLEQLRSKALASLPMETLWAMLQADWYAHQWPADKEIRKLADPLLIHAWCSKAASMSVQELTDDPMRIQQMQKCYDFWDALSMGYVLQTLAPQQLAAVFASPGAWMPSASAQHRSKLVQWYLLRTKGRIGDDWKQWFSGRDAREAEAAGFWLDQGLTPTGDIRQWIQQLIIRKLLPPDRVEQWVQDDSTQAVQLFEYLPAPLQQRFLARWQQHASELAAVLNNVNPGLIEPFFLQGVLPLGLEAREILTLYAPSSAWMHSVSDQHRSKLMQWYLLHTSGRIGDDWKQWFSGRDAQEAEAAGLWLDQGLAATDDIRQWMQQLITSGLLPHSRVEQWVQDDSTEAVQLFEYLPELQQQRFLATWQQHPSTLAAALSGAKPSQPVLILLRAALALDLETDGQTIWQVGVAQARKAWLLFDQKTSGAGDLGSALAQLEERIRASVLSVGHNIVAWDWPILSQHISLSRPPVFWDTLLVQYLLEPQALSHALGGSHQADEDALAAAQLFEQQFKRVPPSFAASLLMGEFKDTQALLEAVIDALGNGEPSYARAMPDWMQGLDSGGAVLVLPERLLRALDWVPGISVVSAHPHEDLPTQWLQVDADALAAALAQHDTHEGDFGLASQTLLLAVARRAEEQGIALRRNMVAPWLLENNARLKTALEQACRPPVPGALALRVAPLPRDIAPLLAAGPQAFAFAGFSAEVLVLDHQGLAQWPADWNALPSGQHPPALLRGRSSTGEVLWLQADRVASVLGERGGWQSFRTAVLPKGRVLEPLAAKAVVQRPVLATRRLPVLYPGAQDQADYWIEVIRTFREVADRRGEKAVPILLVSSTRSAELVTMLRWALAEMGWGEVSADHHSLREYLLRAARYNFAVVDTLARWPEWQARALSTGVALLPVVEALPLEQWYAAADTQWAQPSECDADEAAGVNDDVAPLDALETDPQKVEGDGSGEGDDELAQDVVETVPLAEATAGATVDAAGEVAAISTGSLLERLPRLAEQFLHAWLVDTGLADSPLPAVLVDARAAGGGKSLEAWAEQLPLHGQALSAPELECLKVAFDKLHVQREEAPSDYVSMEQFLVQNWQPKGDGSSDPVRGFKDSQQPAMQAICNRQSDVICALPTGEGKSVLFQVPALCRGLRNRRLTLVISPLKALMHDQVDGLRKLGFADSADYLSSDRPAHEIAEVMQGVLDHRIVLLYVAPERFRSDPFIQVLRKRLESDGGLEYAVVDEAHCVNQWGHEFRPDYFYALQWLLRNTRRDRNDVPAPFVLLSATITASDKKALQSILQTGSQAGKPALPLVVLPVVFEHPLRAHIQVQTHSMRGMMSDSQAFEQVLDERLPAIVGAIRQAQNNRQKTGQRSAVIVFVARRDHAEKVAQKLTQLCACPVECFHAGLDALARSEVYQSFRNGNLDVLVATKAFGMGMDIPDIHWAIHLSPPAFLEDYLQEVGRIGRGVLQRQKAQLKQLSAGLLYSAADFDGIRDQRAQGAVQLAFIKEQYKELTAQARPLDGGWLALVPHEGFKPAAKPAMRRAHATKLRMALYWMERAGSIELCGSVPNLLPVTVHFPTLQRIAKEDGALSVVARVILGMESIHQAADRAGISHAAPSAGGQASQGMAGNWLARALGLIGDMAGLMFGSSAPTRQAHQSAASPVNAASAAPGADAAGGNALVNLSQIMLHCSFRTLSDVMASLVDLEKRGGITLVQRYQFAVRALASEPKPQIHRLFGAVEAASLELLRRLSVTGVNRFLPADLLQGHMPALVDPAKTSLYQSAVQWGVIQLVRASGIRVHQTSDSNQKLEWEAVLAPSALPQAKARCKKLLAIAQTVFDMLAAKNQPQSSTDATAEADQNIVSLRELVDATRAGLRAGQRFRESDLKKALGLLSAMKLVSLAADLLPMSYVLHLDALNAPLDSHQSLWDELKEVNLLAKLRNDAMEVFANLPTDAQSPFVEGYFAQADAKGLEDFIDTQLGNIDGGNDQGLSAFIQSKREQLRATEVGKFFERYKSQPNQWAALTHPYDQHLLVNAGPGAGKTSVLVGRILHLIREQNIQPSEIIVLAFNRAVVFEIKKRLQSLFRSLGYAAYVKRLQVFTFHAFAMRSLVMFDEGRSQLPNREDLLDFFAWRLEFDANFRQQVAGGCRSILVDEFQDVSHSIYQILLQLYQGSGSRAGVMVIGDDDQDILRWYRKERIANGKPELHEFAEKYFKDFERDFSGDGFANLLLDKNFRSDDEIVKASQRLIETFSKKNSQFRRIKNSPLEAVRNENKNTRCEKKDVCGQSWQQVVSQLVNICREHIQQRWGSLAVLCRTNAEVAEAHRVLSNVFPGITTQGRSNLRVAEIRHVALWIDHLNAAREDQNLMLTDVLKKQLIASFGKKFDIPENRVPDQNDVHLEDLWELCCAEQPFPHLSDLISFINDLQTDELERLLGASTNRSQMVVSTIHKVKGLEFDTVIIIPSALEFGNQRAAQPSLEKDAAEEIRLFYVGMTRAKTRLFYFLGDREYAWGIFPPRYFQGRNKNESILVGSHEEVSLGWAMNVSVFNTDPEECQAYIEKVVSVGDAITLGGRGGGVFKELWHRDANGQMHRIGYLAAKTVRGGPQSTLKVSAVVRFRADGDGSNTSLTKYAPSVQQRGWGYTVLVSGRLR